MSEREHSQHSLGSWRESSAGPSHYEGKREVLSRAGVMRRETRPGRREEEDKWRLRNRVKSNDVEERRKEEKEEEQTKKG